MSMKMTMAEFVGLEHCPFCKGEAFYNPGYNGGNVECRECGAEGPYKRTEAEAIAAWNSRAKPPCDGGYCPLCGAYDEWESYKHSVPATEENMAKFGWVRERTCEFNIKDNMNETEGMGDVWNEHGIGMGASAVVVRPIQEEARPQEGAPLQDQSSHTTGACAPRTRDNA